MNRDQDQGEISQFVGKKILGIEIDQISPELEEKVKKNNFYWRRRENRFPDEGANYDVYSSPDLPQIEIPGKEQNKIEEKSIGDQFERLSQIEFGIKQQEKLRFFNQIRENGVVKSSVAIDNSFFKPFENEQIFAQEAQSPKITNNILRELNNGYKATLKDIETYDFKDGSAEILYKLKTEKGNYTLGLAWATSQSDEALELKIYQDETEIYSFDMGVNHFLEDSKIEEFFKS